MKVSLYSNTAGVRMAAVPVLSLPHRSFRQPASPVLGRVGRSLAGTSPGVAWMLSIAAVFLATGIAGAIRPVMDLPPGMSAAPPPAKEPVVIEDITMADLAGEHAEEPAEEAPPAEEVPAATDTPPEPLLTEQDIVPIPDAPLIEPALVPLTITASKPRPSAPVVTRPAAPAPRPAAVSTSASQGTAGGGGTAAVRSSGRGKFPRPPYPAFARARGLTGTVTLSIRVAPGGEVLSASVAGGSGSSALDNHAASWVTRRWKWPSGAVRSFRLPVTFRLR